MMKTIKLKINQQLLLDVLDEAMMNARCELWVRLVLGELRWRKNNLFREKKAEVQLTLKPHEALALWTYMSLKPNSLPHSIASLEIIDKMLRQEIVTQKELK